MDKEQRIQQAVEFVFTKYDTDKSGYLEENELKEVLAAVFAKMGVQRPVEEKDVKKMLLALDTNKDGQICREELRILVEQCLK
jgi:Ca2+-binding EF-hand superfamily protein